MSTLQRTYYYFRKAISLRNEPLLTYELTNLRIVTILVLFIDLVCHFIMDEFYFDGANRTVMYYLRLYLWVPSVVILFFLSFSHSAQYYLKSLIFFAILLHGHVYVTATFFLGHDGIVYGGMFVIITAVLCYFPFKFPPKTTIALVGSMMVIYWISAAYNLLQHVPRNIDGQLILHILYIDDVKNIFLALFGSTAIVLLLDFSYYQMTSVKKFLYESAPQISEYDSRRLLWLENMSRFLKHEMDNSVLSINMEISNIKRKDDALTLSDNFINIESEIKQIERLVAITTQANELEKSLVPQNRKRVDIDELISSYVNKYSTGREDVSLVYEAADINALVLCDIDTFTQMLDKIVSNCVDFSDSNCNVIVRVFNQEDRNIIVEISNTGPPVIEDNTSSLFEIFHGRVGDDHSGLGLFIAKTIVEYHAGAIEAFNAETGPVFRVTIPAEFIDPGSNRWKFSSYFNRL